MQTSRTYSTVAKTQFRLRYLSLIRMFFADHSMDFNRELETHGGIISGSVALLFLLSTTSSWQPNDMDIYISQERYEPFLSRLEATCQVTYQPRERTGPKEDYPDVFISNVRQYSTPTGLRLDVIQSATTSPVTPLPNFWTSLVVNFLTPNAAVCGYPRDTLSHRGLVREGWMSISSMHAWDKYNARGFTFAVVSEWGTRAHDDPDVHFVPGNLLTIDFRNPSQTAPLTLPVQQLTDGWVAKHPSPPMSSGMQVPAALPSHFA